jgi:hypothetical protein
MVLGCHPRWFKDAGLETLPPLATGEGFTAGLSGWRGFKLGKAVGRLVQK